MWAPSTSASVMMMTLLVAQPRRRCSASPVPQPRAWIRSGSSWFSRSLSAVALATFRILPRSGRMAWVSRLRACLGRAAGRIALDQEDLGAGRGACCCSRRACRAGGACGSRSCAAVSRSCLRRSRSSALATTCSSSTLPRLAVAGQPVLEVVARRWSRPAWPPRRLTSRSLVWPWNCGCSMNTETRPAAPLDHVVGGDDRALAVAGQLGVALQARAPGRCAGPTSCVPPSAVGTVLQ